MNSCIHLWLSLGSISTLAALALRPPLIPLPALIAVLFVATIVLFLVRSNLAMKQMMLDRTYGPGVKRPPTEWWEADLDPIFKRAVIDRMSGWLRHHR